VEPHDVRVFRSAAEFRAWLEKHHDTATELWVGYYKKGVPKTSMTYAQAVDEALCFGWIDGIGRRIDDEVHANRWTPRRRTSSWSAVNIAKVAELTAAGRMHPAGLRAFDERDRRKDATYSYERPVEMLPQDLLDRFQADESAWASWQSRPPSLQRQATYWILSGKRSETRERRFVNLLEELATGRLPRPFLVTRQDRSERVDR
jgi:uncharacterized protein YdeI (YjbR/CyaY-like superfamily)